MRGKKKTKDVFVGNSSSNLVWMMVFVIKNLNEDLVGEI
jgi:hypothetical protein